VSAVVSDTSPLHYLIECNAIEILPALFQEILIPPTVHQELSHNNTPPRVKVWAQNLPAWVRIQAPLTIDHSLNADRGEVEAICLARETKAIAILMDDRKGRIEAIRCGLRVAGTIGLLETAARRGLVDFAEAVQRLRQTNARLDDEIIRAALTRLRSN
jgi:predicted nucleic acid-binding protein